MVLIAITAAATSQVLVATASEQDFLIASKFLGNANVVSALIFVFLGGALLVAGPNRIRALVGVRYLLIYPPTWLAVALSSAILVFYNESWRQLTAAFRNFIAGCHPAVCVLWIVLVVHLAALVAFELIDYLVRRERPKADMESMPTRTALPDNFDDLVAWLQNDSPITTPRLDRFGHVEFSERVCKRLREPQEPAIALIGPKGSGKTSICELVKANLSRDERIHIVQVSLWAYADGAAATNGVLSALVRALGRSVSTFEVDAAPSQYIQSISSAAGPRWLQTVLGALARQPSPEEILSHIESVALATQHRYVIWIEDFERFRDAAPARASEPHEPSPQTHSMMLSLLHLLDGRSNLSVVFADETVPPGFDMIKLVRYTYHVPRLDLRNVMSVIQLLRNRCLTNWPRPHIDPTSHKRREAIATGALSNLWSFDVSRVISSATPQLDHALCTILHNPRTLKTALRLVMQKWKELVGEIDFDDVLIMCAIRARYEDLFAHVSNHIDVFRGGFGNDFKPETIESRPEVAAYRQLLSRIDAMERPSVEKALRSVFPILPTFKRGGSTDETAEQSPQRLFIDLLQCPDRWSMFQSESFPPEYTSDQRVLAAIDQWNNSRSTTLLDLCLDAVAFHRVQGFSSRVRAASVEDLALGLSAMWERTRSLDALVQWMSLLRELLSRIDVDRDTQHLIVAKLINQHATRSISYAHILTDRLLGGSQGPRAAAIENPRACFVVLAESLADSFDSEASGAIMRSFVSDEKHRWMELWQWLARFMEADVDGRIAAARARLHARVMQSAMVGNEVASVLAVLHLVEPRGTRIIEDDSIDPPRSRAEIASWVPRENVPAGPGIPTAIEFAQARGDALRSIAVRWEVEPEVAALLRQVAQR